MERTTQTGVHLFSSAIACRNLIGVAELIAFRQWGWHSNPMKRSIAESPVWKALPAHHAQMAGRHMRELFAMDAQRFERFSLRFQDLLVDYSKNRIVPETMPLLFDL